MSRIARSIRLPLHQLNPALPAPPYAILHKPRLLRGVVARGAETQNGLALYLHGTSIQLQNHYAAIWTLSALNHFRPVMTSYPRDLPMPALAVNHAKESRPPFP